MNIQVLAALGRPLREGDFVWKTRKSGAQRYEILRVAHGELYCLNLSTGEKTWLSPDEVTLERAQ